MVKRTIAEWQKNTPQTKNNLQSEKRLFSRFNPHANGWTQFEDKILLSNINNTNGQKIDWHFLKDLILERTGKDRTSGSTKARYYYLVQKLNKTPNINKPKATKKRWSMEEDKLLLKLIRFNSLADVYVVFNQNLVGLNLPIRTLKAIKWRYYLLIK